MTQDSQRIERDVQAALEAEPARIAERVRTITLEALTRGVVDTQALREVTQAVLRGAQAAAPRLVDGQTEAIKDAVRGLDEALASAAQATQLAASPAITIASPARCGKSLRTKSSVLGQTRQRASRGGGPAANAPSGTATAAPHAGQSIDARDSMPSRLTVAWQAGQA